MTSSISGSRSSGSSVSHRQQQQQQDRSHQLFLRGGGPPHRDLERERMKKVDRDQRGDNGNSREGGTGSGSGADSSILTIANVNNDGSNVNNNGNNVKTTTTSTSSSLCTPVTVLDSIPFLYTKNMFISYELEAVDESTTTTNEEDDESNKKFLDFHNIDINTNSKEEELLLQTILQDSFIQAYNELVTDCPIFNDDTTEDSQSSSPTRELHDSYFLFGYDHNDERSQNKLDTKTPDDFTTSFILMSLDLKCSYCQENLSLLQQQGQQEEAEGLLLSDDSNDDNNNCMISLFDYHHQEQLSIRNPSCSCGIPSNDDFLIEYANKINNNAFISSLGMKIKFDVITEIKVEQEPVVDVDEAATIATIATTIATTDIEYTSNNEQQQESLPLLGWDIPIEISPVSVGCLPSAFVLKEDEHDNEEVQDEDEQPVKISRTTGSYNNGSGSGSGRKCKHLSISNGVPSCGSGTTTTRKTR